MAGSETGPSRGGLTAGHTILSADCADYAVEARRRTDTSPGRALRISSQVAAILLAFASLAAGTAPTAAAQEAPQRADASGFNPDGTPSVLTNANPETARRAELAPAVRGNTLERNPPPTGHLIVGGYGTRSWTDSLRVNASLNVSTDSIRDADGLDHVEWEYQWIRVTTGGGETNIAEATRSWYYVSESDLGHRLKVRVTFQDDEGNWERIDSELSAIVDVMTTEEHALISLEADKDTVEVGQWVNFTIRRRGEMQQQIRGDINVQGLRSDIEDWYLYAYVFRGQATRNWNLQVEAEPGGVHTPGRTITALLRGVFEDFALVDTTAVTVVVVPAGTRNRGDVGPPDAQSATVDASTLVIWYDETLGSGSNPPASAYSVSINSGSGMNPTAVEVAGRTVTLTLGTPAAYGDQVTVSYTAPNTGAVQDEAQNDAGDLTNYPVTNNTAAPTPTIDAPATLSLNEDVGTYSFSVSLSRSINQSVTVGVAAQAGTATASDDFQVSSGTLTIPAGQTSSDTHTITIDDDDIDEGSETFSLVLSSPSSGATLGNSTTTVTITDDDTRGLFPSPRSVTVPEDGTETYTVVLESEPTSTVTVTASRSGDADITVARGASLEFTTGNWYVPQTVELSAAADADSVDGTATITHTASGGDYGSNNVSATVAATEGDTSDDGENNNNNNNTGHSVSTGVTLSLGPSGVGESEGQRTVTVTGRLNGDAMESAKTISVSVGAGGDGAVSGTDYTTSGGFSFEIPGGQTEGSGTFTITATDDDVDEGNETITVSGVVSGLDVTPATLRIVDDDTRGLFPSPGSVTVPEEGTQSYTLVLESEPTAAVTVKV
ncbi:Calx-beta domain-containing protein [Candidatus Palauibacter sp.]|uniref:Calx-beta domain-containing protein n=1 Tax=Candidatus Palauibacter sp. TaxID=3101350 RepID=UPI003B522349